MPNLIFRVKLHSSNLDENRKIFTDEDKKSAEEELHEAKKKQKAKKQIFQQPNLPQGKAKKKKIW